MLMQQANLAIRFLLELSVLASLGYWGFRLNQGPLARYAVGLGAPLLVALIWSVFGSPKASMPLSGLSRLALELAVFGLGVVALYASGRPLVAAALGAIMILNRALMYIWRQ